MSGPACYVVNAAEWSAAGDALAQLIFLLLGSVWAASVDWWRVHDLFRSHLRRRRIRAIRQARGVRA